MDTQHFLKILKNDKIHDELNITYFMLQSPFGLFNDKVSAALIRTDSPHRHFSNMVTS